MNAEQPDSGSGPTSRIGADQRESVAALRALLRDRDVACPYCGHNMRDGDPLRCSECGKFVASTLSQSPAVLAQRNPRLIHRDWLIRCFAFTPAAMHISFGVSFTVAILLAWRDGFPATTSTLRPLAMHLISGTALAIVAYIYLRFRRHRAPGLRLAGFSSGVLLLVLTLLSIFFELLVKNSAYN